MSQQPLPIREQLKALETLQEFDLKIDALQKKKAALPAAMKAAEDALNKARVAIEAKKTALGEIEKVQRQAQAAMELNRDRLGRANVKLEGVQNGPEYNAANREIEQLKKMNAGFEEQQKKSAADAAAIQAEIDRLAGEMTKAQQARDAQAQVADREGGQLQTEINALLAERNKVAPNVEKRILLQYDRVRGARAGLGFVPALGGRCKGCNMMVPPQLYNQVQRGDAIHACPNCHRFIFVPVQS